MPSPETAGGVVDPFATEPLDETLAGERGPRTTLLVNLARVRAVVREHVVEYEATLGEPTPELLLDLVDEMVRRLEALGGG